MESKEDLLSQNEEFEVTSETHIRNRSRGIHKGRYPGEFFSQNINFRKNI